MGGDISINITIVGAQSTGKSTIVYKYTGRNYLHSRQHTKEMQPMTTIHSAKQNNKFYELCIRDTCGSSIADIRSHSLCSNTDAIIICFNINESSTFEKAKRWILDLTHNNKETYPILLLIGTSKYQDAILSKHHFEAEQYAKQNNIYYQTVCLSQTLEIENIFTTIIDAFSAPLMKDKNKTKNKNKQKQKQNDENIEKQKLVEEKDDIKQEESIKIKTLKPLQRDCEALKMKIILLGDSGVGKTTFRRRLEVNNFDNDVLATIGVDCSCFVTSKKYRNHSIEILLMDPSGQETFKNITKQYYRGIHGVILMCDIININSWKNIKFWMDEIKRNCFDDIHIILICNKMDLLTDKNKKISGEIINNAKLYSNMFNIKTYNISCKTGEYIKYVRKGFVELIGHIINDKQLFERLKKERGHEIVKRLKGTFAKSESFISVDGRPYDINKSTIKRTCNVCDH